MALEKSFIKTVPSRDSRLKLKRLIEAALKLNIWVMTLAAQRGLVESYDLLFSIITNYKIISIGGLMKKEALFFLAIILLTFFYTPKEHLTPVLLGWLIFIVGYGFNEVIKILNEIKSNIKEVINEN